MQVEVDMIELTLEQVRALAQTEGPPTVIDPTTRKTYALVPTEEVSSVSRAGSGPTPQEKELPRETLVAPWQHLVARRHPWRKQLYIKGRNMTVRQLIGTVKANRFSVEEAAADLHLPVEAIREALAYFEANPEVIELDAAQERYLLSLEGGRGRGPESLPR
jgi:uncharacterized protein (DUF433 family)